MLVDVTYMLTELTPTSQPSINPTLGESENKGLIHHNNIPGLQHLNLTHQLSSTFMSENRFYIRKYVTFYLQHTFIAEAIIFEVYFQ